MCAYQTTIVQQTSRRNKVWSVKMSSNTYLFSESKLENILNIINNASVYKKLDRPQKRAVKISVLSIYRQRTEI